MKNIKIKLNKVKKNKTLKKIPQKNKKIAWIQQLLLLLIIIINQIKYKNN